MIHRIKSKRQVRAERQFVEKVTAFVVGLGARPGTFYDYALDTPAGLLHISVNEGWVATRFEDVGMGRAFTESCGRSSNPYSGKWNFHYADTIGINVILADLGYWFGLLMEWEPTS